LRKITVTGLLVGVFLLALAAGAEARVPVRLISRYDPSDWVGKRLVRLIAQGIGDSKVLAVAQAGDNPVLICEFLTVKMKGRPVSAYSYILYSNGRRRLSPVLGHYLGLCSNLTVQDAARRIVSALQNAAKKMASSAP